MTVCVFNWFQQLTIACIAHVFVHYWGFFSFGEIAGFFRYGPCWWFMVVTAYSYFICPSEISCVFFCSYSTVSFSFDQETPLMYIVWCEILFFVGGPISGRCLLLLSWWTKGFQTEANFSPKLFATCFHRVIEDTDNVDSLQPKIQHFILRQTFVHSPVCVFNWEIQ